MGLKIVPQSPDFTLRPMDELLSDSMHKSGLYGICSRQNLWVAEFCLVPQSKVY